MATVPKKDGNNVTFIDAQGKGISEEGFNTKIGTRSRRHKLEANIEAAIDGVHPPRVGKGEKSRKEEKRARRALCKGEWRETKRLRFYLADGERIRHLFGWHQIERGEELAEASKTNVKATDLVPEDR